MKTAIRLEKKGYKVVFSMQNSKVCFVDEKRFENITQAYKYFN